MDFDHLDEVLQDLPLLIAVSGGEEHAQALPVLDERLGHRRYLVGRRRLVFEFGDPTLEVLPFCPAA